MSENSTNGKEKINLINLDEWNVRRKEIFDRVLKKEVSIIFESPVGSHSWGLRNGACKMIDPPLTILFFKDVCEAYIKNSFPSALEFFRSQEFGIGNTTFLDFVSGLPEKEKEFVINTSWLKFSSFLEKIKTDDVLGTCPDSLLGMLNLYLVIVCNKDYVEGDVLNSAEFKLFENMIQETGAFLTFDLGSPIQFKEKYLDIILSKFSIDKIVVKDSFIFSTKNRREKRVADETEMHIQHLDCMRWLERNRPSTLNEEGLLEKDRIFTKISTIFGWTDDQTKIKNGRVVSANFVKWFSVLSLFEGLGGNDVLPSVLSIRRVLFNVWKTQCAVQINSIFDSDPKNYLDSVYGLKRESVLSDFSNDTSALEIFTKAQVFEKNDDFFIYGEYKNSSNSIKGEQGWRFYFWLSLVARINSNPHWDDVFILGKMLSKDKESKFFIPNFDVEKLFSFSVSKIGSGYSSSKKRKNKKPKPVFRRCGLGMLLGPESEELSCFKLNDIKSWSHVADLYKEDEFHFRELDKKSSGSSWNKYWWKELKRFIPEEGRITSSVWFLKDEKGLTLEERVLSFFDGGKYRKEVALYQQKKLFKDLNQADLNQLGLNGSDSEKASFDRASASSPVKRRM